MIISIVCIDFKSSVSAYYSLFFKVTVSSLTILTIFVENVLDLHIEMIFVIFLTIYFIENKTSIF